MKRPFLTTIVVAFLLCSAGVASCAETVTYIYDDLKRLQRVVTENGFLVDYVYDNAGNRTAKDIQGSGRIAVASLSVFPSDDTDFIVFFDAAGSACFEDGVAKDCEYSLDIGGTGILMGGNGIDSWVYQYDEPGTYESVLTVSFPDASGVSDTRTAIVSPLEVEIPKPSIDFSTVVNGNEVTLMASGSGLENILSAYVYWGDRSMTDYTDPQNEFAGGVVHVYDRSRVYNIRVLAFFDLDSSDNGANYTCVDDEDLTVYIP